jgi:hypothetical protein
MEERRDGKTDPKLIVAEEAMRSATERNELLIEEMEKEIEEEEFKVQE